MSCPFRLAVINDEITQDFGRACEIASKDFGLSWIELRAMWNKNIVDLDAAEIAESRKILEKNNLRVTDIASPLFKVDWPGAPLPKGRKRHDQFGADFDFKQQQQVLERCIELAKAFQTDRIRCFDFWRLDDQAPYRAAINDKLREAAVLCAKSDKILLLENEMSCNTATGEEAAAVLHAIPNKNFMLIGIRETLRRWEAHPIRMASIFCPNIASGTAIVRMWCASPAEGIPGLRSVPESSIGLDSFAHSSGTAITTLSVWKRTGAERELLRRRPGSA